MIKTYNQTDIKDNHLMLRYDSKLRVFGTDGVLFAIDPNTGDIYRALETVDIMADSPLNDPSKWLKVDLVHKQKEFNTNIGAVKNGFDLLLGTGLTIGVGQGRLTIFDPERIAFDIYDIPEQQNKTFDYIDTDGNITDANQTEIDPLHYVDGGTVKELNKSYNTTFQKLYLSKNGDLKIVRGDRKYTSLNTASYQHIDEPIPDLQEKGLYFIGGLLIRKDTVDLGSKNVRQIYASKLGEAHIGSGGSYFSLLETPTQDESTLADIEAPKEGETRQLTSYLPDIVLYTFNKDATDGIAPTDGSQGYWNKLEGGGKLDTVNINTDFTAEAGKQYLVDSTNGDIVATIPNPDTTTKGKYISVTKVDENDNEVIIENENGDVLYTVGTTKQSVELIYTEDSVRVLSDFDPQPLNVDYSAVGRFVFQVEDHQKGIYALNGQTVKDKLLAEHINANASKYVGFSVNGYDVTLPDWRGDILYGAGGRGLPEEIGELVEQDLQEHTHAIKMASDDDASGSGYPIEGSHAGYWRNTTTYGGLYTRVYGRTATLCIIGTSYIKLDRDSTIATAVTVTFNGATVDNGETSRTILEGVHAYRFKVDLPVGKELDTVSNAVIEDRKKGYINVAQAMGGGDLTVNIATRNITTNSIFKVLDNNTEAFMMRGDKIHSCFKDNALTSVTGIYAVNDVDCTIIEGINWASTYNFGSRDIALGGGGIDLNTRNFEFSFWHRVAVVRNSNYLIGNSQNRKTQKSIHIGWRDSDTFTVAFYGADVNFDGLKQSDFTDTLHHIFISHNASTKQTSLYIDNTFIGELIHSANYLSNFDRIFSTNASTVKCAIEATLLRCNIDTNYNDKEAHAEAYYNFDRALLGI
jgi:hypothetical protein